MTVNSPFSPDRFHNLRFSVFNPRFLWLLKDIAIFCHPTETKRSTRLFFRSLYWAKYSGQWFQQISNSALLQELVIQDTNLAEKLHRNILRMDNPREKCFQLLSEHYPTAEQLLTPKLIERALLKGGVIVVPD
jgi:uncharacterized protein VirK/YbjX